MNNNIRHRNFSVRTLDLRPENVSVGMCVFPKNDINIDGIVQKKNEPCIIMKSNVDFYKNNCDNYTWQKINHFKQNDPTPSYTNNKKSGRPYWKK